MKFPIERIMRYTTDDGIHVKCEKMGELVRCKDCRFHEREQPGMVWCPCVVGSWMAEDGFCSMGERREDE